jgi:hypothetical protein
MAYTIAQPVKLGPQVLEQVVSIDITLDTTTTGSVTYPFGTGVAVSDVQFSLQNIGAVACVAALGTITTSTIGLTSNGTAGAYRLYCRTHSQAG